MKTYNEIVDEYSLIHHMGDIIGQGGQGIVFRTKDPDLAIKIVTDNGVALSDSNRVEKYAKRFKRVRILPLPEGLNISLPAALLKDKAGYVMQLLSEMVPFSHFFINGNTAKDIKTRDIPEWLSAIPESDAKKIVHYYQTGGLRRRLHALYKSASLLARLHANGLVYGDISPNNIFISESLDSSSVWLIDADNIRFEINDGGSIVYTPKYGAPELVKGKDGGRPSSDCHAFAVVAFYLLCLVHPFIGRKVNGSEENDWADDQDDGDDLENKAYAGDFPWIDDEDDSNSSTDGLPRALILDDRLKVLFDKTFGGGRTMPWLRPSMYSWAESLAQATDLTVQCPDCTMQYYHDFIHPETNAHCCPYCKVNRPQVIVIESYRWRGSTQIMTEPCWRYVREFGDNAKAIIPRRVLADFNMQYSDVAEIELHSKGNALLLKKSNQGDIEVLIASAGGEANEFKKISSQVSMNITRDNVNFYMFANTDNPRLLKVTIKGVSK